jgi:hypothetical protein
LTIARDESRDDQKCHYHDSIEWCHKGARRFVAFAELIVVAPLAGRRSGKGTPSAGMTKPDIRN